MKIKDFYKKIIEWGVEEDFRSREEIKTILKENKKIYQELSKKEKKYFDKDRLFNPYDDTRIINGDEELNVKDILMGIDIDVQELLLAERLKEKGKNIDLVIAHHPVGRAYAHFYRVMSMQADIVSRIGVPINVAESYIEERMKEVAGKVKPLNHFRTYDAAKLLGIPLMNIHTPADNHVARFLQQLFDKEKPKKLKDVIELLNEIPEYKIYREKGEEGVIIVVGDKNRKAGKIFVDMTGGTEGPVEIIPRLVNAGINTVVGMHFSEKHVEMAKKQKLNLIIAGHISSDVLGLNLILDKAETYFHRLNIIPVSGFYRVNR